MCVYIYTHIRIYIYIYVCIIRLVKRMIGLFCDMVGFLGAYISTLSGVLIRCVSICSNLEFQIFRHCMCYGVFLVRQSWIVDTILFDISVFVLYLFFRHFQIHGSIILTFAHVYFSPSQHVWTFVCTSCDVFVVLGHFFASFPDCCIEKNKCPIFRSLSKDFHDFCLSLPRQFRTRRCFFLDWHFVGLLGLINLTSKNLWYIPLRYFRFLLSSFSAIFNFWSSFFCDVAALLGSFFLSISDFRALFGRVLWLLWF